MNHIVDATMNILRGPADRRNHAILSLVCWFTMGAFLVSTASHYLNLSGMQHGVAVVVGGGVCAAIGLCIKAA